MDKTQQLMVFAIDDKLRTITMPNNGSVFGVSGDIEVNQVEFQMPRYCAGFDMTDFTGRVNYVNPNGDSNYYESEISGTDDTVSFIWLMKPDVTRYSGDVKFSVKLYKKQDGKILKQFNTRSAVGRVLEGFDVIDSVTPEEQETLLHKIEAEIKEEVKAYIDQYAEDKVSEMTQGLPEAVNSLKEDISNKITKFFASNQGETHITDSDTGKIQDMMIYGKSLQDGTPSPENPVEIKSVVNPTVKIVGANIMQLNSIGEITVGGSGITVSCKDGVIKAKGTALKDYTMPLGGSAEFIVMKSMTLQNSKTYIFNPNPIKQTESSECYLDFTNANNLGISLSNNNINNPFKPTDSQTQYPFNLNIIVKQGTVVDAEWKPQLLLNESLLPYKPYTEQSVTLPITLNAIPVSSGGNVTIDGQQYIADYVDVERGKLVRMVGVTDQDTFETSKWDNGSIVIYSQLSNVGTDSAIVTISSKFISIWSAGDEIHHFTQPTGQTLVMVLPKTITTIEQGEEIRAKGFKFYYILVTPIEIDLTEEENAALKELVTYYPVTNISIDSEQIDGYTVFNYPISMANGWNYVKQQLNDNRDYIYDMDLQSAEAYVNSEYAVALTELEV